jgi:hypothetical protein
VAFLSRRELAAIVVLLLTTVAVAAGGPAPLTDAQAKAGFLYNCAMFIAWPSTAMRSGELLLGVAGDDQIVVLMNEMNGRQVNGRTLRVRTVKALEDVRDLQILFVGDATPSAPAFVARVGDQPVLTVGSMSDFTAKGGVVRLYTEQQRLRFEINMTQADRVGLKVSAKMLGLAKIVR